MIGILTLIAYCIGLSDENQPDTVRIMTAQTMAFAVLAFAELIHVFNIRNNKESIFKTGIFENTKLLLATLISGALMLVILLVPELRSIFSVVELSTQNILQVVLLVFMPIIVVELFKLLKINTSSDEE